ncbi:MAG: hypothetical protein DMF98_18370 [Acidobacteria bacterium]|nr:MAG: hypothetical protein DMF98_18370 [Acidobacteriota bacterium]
MALQDAAGADELAVRAGCGRIISISPARVIVEATIEEISGFDVAERVGFEPTVRPVTRSSTNVVP